MCRLHTASVLLRNFSFPPNEYSITSSVSELGNSHACVLASLELPMRTGNAGRARNTQKSFNNVLLGRKYEK